MCWACTDGACFEGRTSCEAGSPVSSRNFVDPWIVSLVVKPEGWGSDPRDRHRAHLPLQYRTHGDHRHRRVPLRHGRTFLDTREHRVADLPRVDGAVLVAGDAKAAAAVSGHKQRDGGIGVDTAILTQSIAETPHPPFNHEGKADHDPPRRKLVSLSAKDSASPRAVYVKLPLLASPC